MRGRNPKFLVPLAVLSAAAVAVSGGLASAAATPTGGPVQIYEADTALAGTVGTVILTGAITDHGKDHQGVAGGGTINRLVLSKGSFEVNLSALGSDLSTIQGDSVCAVAGSRTDQVPIVGGSGTGAYSGMSGTLTVTAAVASIMPRLPSGSCNLSATKYPGVLIASGSGTVTFNKN